MTDQDRAPPPPPAVLVGAGDIADGGPGAEQTARLVEGVLRQSVGTVFTLGDNAYPHGTADEFARCYHPTWGGFRDRTRPAPGNHDYDTPGAAAYFDYFGAAAGDRDKGYYSYDLGAWHIVVLNSNCEHAGCSAGSAPVRWRRADLEAHPARCTLAYWHHPLFTSGVSHEPYGWLRPFWQAL